jgi:hypothetical protein
VEGTHACAHRRGLLSLQVIRSPSQTYRQEVPRRWSVVDGDGRYNLEESFYGSLERYGIIPLHQLRSYFGRDWIDSVTFHRILGPRVVDVAFSGWNSPIFHPGKGPSGLFPSLRALRFYGDYRFDLSACILPCWRLFLILKFFMHRRRIRSQIMCCGVSCLLAF